MITKKFIEKIHYYFDELNYRPKTNLDFDAFCACADNTLAHTETLEDAANTIILYSYCIKKWNKIEKIFSKKSNIFNSLFYRGNSLISLVNDIEAKGVYHITNGINRNVNDIFVISTNDDYSLDFSYKKGVFSIFEDGKYFLKYPNSTMRLRSKASMDMLDKDKNILCNIQTIKLLIF